MESEQLYHRGYCRNSYNSIASASSDEELLDGAGVIMDFHTTEDDNLLDGDAASPGRQHRKLPNTSPNCLVPNLDPLSFHGQGLMNLDPHSTFLSWIHSELLIALLLLHPKLNLDYAGKYTQVCVRSCVLLSFGTVALWSARFSSSSKLDLCFCIESCVLAFTPPTC